MTSTTYPPRGAGRQYPVHVDAKLDATLTRWLWLVKWLLVLPHYVLLFFLWMAFAVLSVVAFFAIVFTGRYPRAIFDFNVGVLRWTWRVTYYAYGTLGTDRYPPFTLAEVPDYPAHFDVEYPDRLSRGLVLVKWWLLAIPHYIVVGIFLGGGWYAADWATSTDPAYVGGIGLIGVLVLMAAVVLLFTGRYPKPVFDLVLGLNRWVLRVAAYAALMTDQYPPFRLDQGGDDPGPDLPTAPSGQPGVAAAPALSAHPLARPASRPWTAGRVIALVTGCVLLLLSAAVGVAGGAAAFLDTAGRDSDGFVGGQTRAFATRTYALTSQTFTIHLDGATGLTPESLVGDARVEVSSPRGDALFVGIADSDAASRYLAPVRHAEVVDFRDVDGVLEPVYRVSGSGAPNVAPTAADLWSVQASGSGDLSLVWPVENGDWTLVVMNADGSDQVAADVSVAATVPWLGEVAVGLLVTAAVVFLAGVVTLVLVLRSTGTVGAS